MKTTEEVLSILVDLKHSINGDCYRGEDFELKLINKAIKKLEELNNKSCDGCKRSGLRGSEFDYCVRI